jgi:pyrroline-5-carboxylate reductase
MRAAVGIVGRGGIGAAVAREWPGLLDEVAGRARIIIVDTEPAETIAVLESLRSSVGGDVSVVSVAAGVTLGRLREAVGPGPALFRVVVDPGIGSRSGVTILCPEMGTAQATVGSIARLLACTGLVAIVPEDMVEAATAVTGSSIGFLALALEGLEDGAVNAGLPRDTARAFVSQTALSTAMLLQNHSGSPADLKDQVASPAGTTTAGLAVLEDQAVRGAYIRVMERATERKRTLRDAGGPPVVE